MGMETCLAQTCSSAVAGTPATIFAQLLQTLIAAQCALTKDYPSDRKDDVSANPDEIYDFVIIGGGSAGSVLANRLSENPNWKILLIEAGEDPSIISNIPALLLSLQGSKEDYAYDVEPGDFCKAMKNKRCKWAKGKALGGSSVINAMLHIHGNDRDFDNWEKKGNAGWGFEDILPYLKKSENYPQETIAKHGDKYFGTSGPLNVRLFNYSESTIQDITIEAAQEIGLPLLEPINGENHIGFGRAHGTLDNGARFNVARAFLTPAKDRRNLYVMKSSIAEKIILEGNRAKGAIVKLPSGNRITVKASKEVILSAGTIASPHLLMLSGIGPRKHLEEFGIPVVADLPVGQNLQDHIMWLGFQLEFINTTKTDLPATWLLDEAYKYLIYRTGEFSTCGSINMLGFVNLKDPQSKYPDIQFHHNFIQRGLAFKADALAGAFNLDDETNQVMQKATLKTDALWMLPVLLNPKSIGELKLQSSNPKDQIKIHANYYTDPEDVETMLRNVDFVKKLIKAKPFAKLGTKLRYFEIPGCSDTKFDTREYWECSLRHVSSTIYHPVGTAKMGPSNDPTAVVDPSLKVRGIQSLRVVDASIMPAVTSGNIHSPTLMIAEKGSDMIKAEWMGKEEL